MKSTLLTLPLALGLLLWACRSPQAVDPAAAATLGQQAPDLHLQWLDGSEASTSLAGFRGRVVLLEFWRTW